MHSSLRQKASAIGVVLLLSLTTNAMDAQERTPTARPSWRLAIEHSNAWGVGGGTPSGRGEAIAAAGRRRLAEDSPIAFELGLMFGDYERPQGAQEPANPFGDTSSDTTRRVALAGPFAAMSVDLLKGRRGSVFAETGVHLSLVSDRTRFGRNTTVEQRVGSRLGLMGGVGVRSTDGYGAKVRYFRVSVPSRPVSVVEVVTAITLF